MSRWLLNMSNYLLLFHADLEDTSQLVEGRLILIDTTKNTIVETYIATSGLPGHQSFSDISSKGKGPIPPQQEVNIVNYSVTTTAIYMPQIKGVEGNFYSITPFAVSGNNINRSDMGVHFDANVPGSSGCIVIRTRVGWAAIQERMKKLASEGIKEVDLLISYSR